METNILDEIALAVEQGSAVRGNDGTDCVLRGDGWYFEHFSLSSADTKIISQSGPYMSVGVPHMIETQYRKRWLP